MAINNQQIIIVLYLINLLSDESVCFSYPIYQSIQSMV